MPDVRNDLIQAKYWVIFEKCKTSKSTDTGVAVKDIVSIKKYPHEI